MDSTNLFGHRPFSPPQRDRHSGLPNCCMRPSVTNGRRQHQLIQSLEDDIRVLTRELAETNLRLGLAREKLLDTRYEVREIRREMGLWRQEGLGMEERNGSRRYAHARADGAQNRENTNADEYQYYNRGEDRPGYLRRGRARTHGGREDQGGCLHDRNRATASCQNIILESGTVLLVHRFTPTGFSNHENRTRH